LRRRARKFAAHGRCIVEDMQVGLASVAERVRMGGHDVPEAVVIRRYYSGLRNLFNIYQTVVDTWQVFDNTELSGPHLIAYGNAGKPATIVDPVATWRDGQVVWVPPEEIPG